MKIQMAILMELSYRGRGDDLISKQRENHIKIGMEDYFPFQFLYSIRHTINH